MSEMIMTALADDKIIASVGFGDGHYGPETLGIEFRLHQWQIKKGLSASTYHYGGVRRDMYAAMMEAKEPGKFFNEHIKPFPDVYPFFKVEAMHQAAMLDARPNDPVTVPRNVEELFAEEVEAPAPTQPAPKQTSNATTGSTTTTIVSEPTIETDAPSPGSALALIDTMDDDKLFAPGGVTDAQLEAGRQWYLAEAKKRDISTEKSRAEFKRFARPLQKLRTGIEARAKELTGATKRKIAAIDTEKRRLVQIVGSIEDEVLGPLTAWEQEEEARKIRLGNQVKAIEARADLSYYLDIPSLEAAIAEVEAFDVSTMQEYRLSAESAKEAVLRRLRPELERRKVAEAERLELAGLRRKQAEREEADRLAEQQRQEQERIDAAAEKLAQAKIQQAVESAKVETRQEVIAELAAPVERKLVEENEPDAPELYIYPEIPAPAPVEDVQPFVYQSGTVKSLPIAGMVETHEQAFNREAVAGLMGHAGLDRQTAIRVLTAIKAGNVPHIQIVY